jgi:hypothetical protein
MSDRKKSPSLVMMTAIFWLSGLSPVSSDNSTAELKWANDVRLQKKVVLPKSLEDCDDPEKAETWSFVEERYKGIGKSPCKMGHLNTCCFCLRPDSKAVAEGLGRRIWPPPLPSLPPSRLYWMFARKRPYWQMTDLIWTEWHDWTWNDMKWHEMTWGDMKWHEVTWKDVKRNELPKWPEMTWNDE